MIMNFHYQFSENEFCAEQVIFILLKESTLRVFNMKKSQTLEGKI